jgi:hypothetical protein
MSTDGIGTSPTGGVWWASARVSNRAAMDALLAPLPATISAQARQLAAKSRRGKRGMRYDEETRKAFWLQHSPKRIFLCITFDNVANLDTAATIWAEMENSKEMEGASLTDQQIHEIYSRVTGFPIEVVGRRS